MKTLIHGNAYSIHIPITKDGHGPASPDETAFHTWEVWDQVCQTVCTCYNEEDARTIAQLINTWGHDDYFFMRQT